MENWWYELKMGDKSFPDKSSMVMRVPGGWVYSNLQGTVLIPYVKEHLEGNINKIKTNDRFDGLTNLDISTHYRNQEWYFSLSSFTAAMAYWIVAQNPNKELIDINLALKNFTTYIASFFKDKNLPERFSYKKLNSIITEENLSNLPEILKLNTLQPDFIDLGALARNVFYMLLRETITQE